MTRTKQLPKLPQRLAGSTDTHCHLDHESFGDLVEQVITRAANCGVFRIVAVASGQTAAVFEEISGLCERNQNIFFAPGVHPHVAASFTEWAALAKALSHPKCVAVGEFGLDYFYMNSPKGSQVDAMKRQIELAHRLAKPAILHIRNAYEEALSILDAMGHDIAGVIHCFSSTPSIALEFVKRGFYVSFSGTVTFPKADEVRQAVIAVPDNKILAETDAPYLSPQPLRGRKPNEPARVVYVIEKIAELKGWTRLKAAQKLTDNASQLFGFDKWES